MSFRKYLIEMAYNNGITSDLSREYEWNNIKNTEFVLLINDKISSQHHKLFQYGDSTFYLTTEENEYLGYIEMQYNNAVDAYAITHSSTKLQRGFYNIMFTSILKLTDIKRILSDESLSVLAISSYTKLSTLPHIKMKIYDPYVGKYKEFSKEALLEKPKNRVLIYEGMTDVNPFLIYPRNDSDRKLYETKNSVWDNYFFCENF